VLIPPPRRHCRSAHCFAGTKKDGGVPEGADPRDGVGNAPLRAAVTARAGLAVAGPPAGRVNTLPATAREATDAKPRPHPRYLSALRLGRIMKSSRSGHSCWSMPLDRHPRTRVRPPPARLCVSLQPRQLPGGRPGQPKRPFPAPARSTDHGTQQYRLQNCVEPSYPQIVNMSQNFCAKSHRTGEGAFCILGGAGT
jgi:hypothetical protein